MKLHVNLTRADIARANLLLLTKSAGTLKGIAIMVIVIGVQMYFYSSLKPTTPVDWAVFIAISVVGGIVGFLAMMAICLVWVLANSTEKGGVIGDHFYEITENEFHERTAQNDSSHKWIGMHKPIRSRHLILVRVNAYMFHVLPRRSFESDLAFEICWKEIEKKFLSVA